MIAYIQGTLAYKDPAYTIIDVGGVGYEIKISLQTYSALPETGKLCKLVTWLNIREDAHILFGFLSEAEKLLFLDLISVSGIGPSTALIMLSSLSYDEIVRGIAGEDQKLIQSIKGIGLKTAQRVILELKDKLKKEMLTGGALPMEKGNATVRGEALAALVTLGIPKATAEKSIDAILRSADETISVEKLIRLALR